MTQEEFNKFLANNEKEAKKAMRSFEINSAKLDKKLREILASI